MRNIGSWDFPDGAGDKEVKWNESPSVVSDFVTPWTITGVSLPAKAGNIRDEGSIPGWGRSPGRGHGNPL